MRGALHGGIGKRLRRIVQPERGQDARHVVVVAEVGVDLAVDGEGSGIGVERAVDVSDELDGGLGEAGEELGDVADALGGSEGVAVGVAVPFPEGLVVVVLVPFELGEEVAKVGDLGGGRGEGGEGAEVH